jgi:phosphoribosylformylglycinamidine cyclo-ligase
VTYASAGVDVEAGDRAVELIRGAVSRTHGPQVLGGIGGFAGLLDVSALKGYRRPLLATSTDGVGTKVAIAQALDVHDTIGFDLVGMVVDDVAVCGARPLLMTDYIACGKVVPERIAAIVAGVAAACEQAGCPLVGGETAEHPGILGPTEYDLAGAATGVVEADDLLGPHRVQAGDAVIALASSGLHSNGYSLVRKVIEIAGWTIYRHVAELGHSLGEELLIPTRVYAPDMLDLAAALGGGLHALAHVTGGGLAANLARVLPRGVDAVVDRGTWTPATIFDLIARLGAVARPEMERTFNLGVGMLAVVAPENEREALARLTERGVPAWRCGQIEESCGPGGAGATTGAAVVRGTKGVDGGSVRMIGDHPRG